MLSRKCVHFSALIYIMVLLATACLADVLELGEASVYGKKEQPEAMTFISRASLEDDVILPKWHVSQKIAESVHDDIFSVQGVD